jgi:transcriptional antiterminator RfaH
MSSEVVVDASRWYAIHTHPRQEDRAESNLRSWGLECFYPQIKKRAYNSYTGAPTDVRSALFPRYIFSRFSASNLLHKVRYTRGVNSVVSLGHAPTPIDDQIIEFIKQQVGEDGFVKIGEELKAGDLVVVKDGPLKSLTGILERKMKASDRVVILLTIINYQGHVQVEREFVERVNQLN